MTSMVRTMLQAAAVLALVAGSAAAQVYQAVDTKRDWSVFVTEESGAKTCYVVTRPTKSVALRGGQQVQVNRGRIFLTVAVRPSEGVTQEVSFTSGYPFQDGSTVEATVGSDSFSLFTHEEFPENAWTEGPAADEALVSAFKRGVNAEVKGVSSRGTTTIDTFSLLGFTAALESAQSRCS